MANTNSSAIAHTPRREPCSENGVTQCRAIASQTSLTSPKVPGGVTPAAWIPLYNESIHNLKITAGTLNSEKPQRTCLCPDCNLGIGSQCDPARAIAVALDCCWSACHCPCAFAAAVVTQKASGVSSARPLQSATLRPRLPIMPPTLRPKLPADPAADCSIGRPELNWQHADHLPVPNRAGNRTERFGNNCHPYR